MAHDQPTASLRRFVNLKSLIFKAGGVGLVVLASFYLPTLSGRDAKAPLRDFAVSAGTLGTDGGLLFTGRLTGEVIALDQDNGKQLWQFKTGSSINAPPITFTHKGVQYVSVLSGRGGSNPSRSAGAVIPTGGSVWTFALLKD